MQIVKYLESWQAFAVVAGLLIAYYVVTRSRETFEPEFLDKGNVERTVNTERSSYAQQTNHFPVSHAIPEPVAGTQTPFRVNMYNAYMQ